MVANVPLIPDGQLEAARVTGELKPFDGAMETIEVPVAPALAVAEVELMVKLGTTAPKKMPLMIGPPVRALTVMETGPLIFHTP